MTIISSLFSGISGIASNGSALSVAGDNIANMSTPGFKASAPLFESALVQRIGEAQIGLGSRLAGTSANFTQGAFANSTRSTDLAIQGTGFFIVKDGSENQFYTRAGNFTKDSAGNLVTSVGGYVLQGREVTISGSTETVSGTLGPIDFSTVSSAPTATSQVNFSANLDASADLQTTFTSTSFAAAEASSNFSVSHTIYDSQGQGHSVTTYYNKTAVNTWGYHTLIAGSELSNYTGVAGGTVRISEGVLNFNSSGVLTTQTPNTTGTEASGNLAAGALVTPNSSNGIKWANGAATTTSVTHEFGLGTDSAAVLTQYAASASSVKNITQDGRPTGELKSIEIGSDGFISGSFSNGTTRHLFKIPLAKFPNEEGLQRVGSNLYAASNTSGDSTVGDAGSSGLGEIRAFSIEQSNVDLASEFVKIITFQRAFQASARTVSTAAELLQDLVNLGR